MLGDFRTKPTGNKSFWLLWWRVDDDELQAQAAQYDMLGWFQSGRKLSVVLLLASTAATLIAALFGAGGAASYIEAGLLAVLAACIYRGHRWAMIAAMLLWTLEKGFSVVARLATGGPVGAVMSIIPLLWWAVFMHAFYLAFRVEQERRRLATAGIDHDLRVWD